MPLLCRTRVGTISLAAAVAFTFISLGAGKSAQPSKTINWPHFRFDKDHTGYQPFETTLNKDNVFDLSLQWQADLHGELVYWSSPAVVNGAVYIGEDTGTLWAFSTKGCGSDICNQPLWKSTYLAQIVDSPTIANGVVYVGSQTDFNSNDGKLNAFAADGCGQAECPPLWRGEAGPDSILESSPTLWNGFVFIGSYGGKLSTPSMRKAAAKSSANHYGPAAAMRSGVVCSMTRSSILRLPW